MTQPLRSYQPQEAPERNAEPCFAAKTVREVISWFESQDRGGTNEESQKELERVRRLFADSCGDMALAECKPLHLLKFLKAQSASLHSDWSFRRWLATIQRPFNFAAKMQLIARNPFAGLSWPEGEGGRDLTDVEFRTLLRLSHPHFRRVLLFLKLSGARPGELRCATVGDVDLEAHCIVLRDHKTKKATGDNRRLVLNCVLLKLIKRLMADAPPSGHLFVNKRGRPWQTSALCRNIQRIRKRAGLPASVRLYSTRHSFGTGLLMAGESTATVMELMGHRQLASAQRYYHLSNKTEHLRAAVEKIGVKRKARSEVS